MMVDLIYILALKTKNQSFKNDDKDTTVNHQRLSEWGGGNFKFKF